MSDYRTAEPIRMYIFGNSISCHEAIEGTLWQRTCGMAASAPERDWVHLIIEMLQERTQRKFLTEVSNAADFFERNFRAFSPENFTDAFQAISADIILFQLHHFNIISPTVYFAHSFSLSSPYYTYSTSFSTF